MVAIAMMSDLEVCVHCRRDFRVRVSDDIGFHAHWKGDYYLFDVVLLVPELLLRETCILFILYREVYVAS